jgi:hypothetical protein
MSRDLTYSLFDFDRSPAPSAPGSASSEDAADELRSSGKLQRERRRVLIWFAAQNQPRTRHECAEALYPVSGGLGSACGRVNDLIVLGWLAEVGKHGKRATLALTERGRRFALSLTRAA